jgi:cytochrome c-type biogenesis protein CcmH/NrfF
MMWVSNGALIGVSALLAGFAMRALAHGSSLLWLLPLFLSLAAVLFFLGVLTRQRQAAEAVKRVARHYDLI